MELVGYRSAFSTVVSQYEGSWYVGKYYLISGLSVLVYIRVVKLKEITEMANVHFYIVNIIDIIGSDKFTFPLNFPAQYIS